MKKLYVGCALKLAPPEFVEGVLRLKDGLRRDFEVLDFHGLRKSNHNIYLFDITLVRQCDVMLAVCDEPSFGLGFEVASVLSRKCPVVATAKHGVTVSGFVTDMPAIEKLFSFHSYHSLEEIPAILQRELHASAPKF